VIVKLGALKKLVRIKRRGSGADCRQTWSNRFLAVCSSLGPNPCSASVGL